MIKKFSKPIYSILDKIIHNKYGAPLKMNNDNENILFYPTNINFNPDKDETPFERNSWGRLWVSDLELYRDIKALLNLNDNETKELIYNYFTEKYDIMIRKITVTDYDDWY